MRDEQAQEQRETQRNVGGDAPGGAAAEGAARHHDHGRDGRGSMTCREMALLITDYWEGALPPPEAEVFEEHLRLCPPCEDYLDQLRLTRGTLSRLCERDIPEPVREVLMGAFREWRAGRQG